MTTQLIKVFEARCHELPDCFTDLISNTSIVDIYTSTYARIIYYYLRGENILLNETLKSFHENFRSTSNDIDFQFVYYLGQLRSEIRQFKILDSTLNSILKLQKSNNQNFLWLAESNYLLGNAYFDLSNFEKAYTFFETSAGMFHRLNCPRREVKAHLNQVVSQTHLTTKANFILAFTDVYSTSMKTHVRDRLTASSAQENLAREYQKLGAHRVALVCIQKALRLLKYDFGTQTFYLVLLQRADILMELGRIEEARKDLEMARGANFPEIQGALIVFENKLKQFISSKTDTPFESLNSKNKLTAGWEKRIDPLTLNLNWRNHNLSPNEEKLLLLIGGSTLHKYDLMNSLYPEDISIGIKENRFKNLLGILRKKIPNRIFCEEGKYYFR